ncbi:carboxypeptidase-like regulatory domain-containing protein [Robiginitalea aurantiaca]|uniref:Carboxypeptidase-like regulatory domain-containing protein n=1 Tax=Robiginitalea aurantiaca TaxID=3056915 RepID=A0ABT7WC42_9FLAO|nr:carboxypeptidase-like regulatory domain-containing protein [Robiginitalea aurantiaca]MDM9630472.1 carboxypeptidase-like regulatory domain-containing protein [Robiginitalea aurantiaca]
MKLKYLILGLFALMVFNSCGGDSDEEISTPDPTSADIRGSVNLYDEGTTEIDNSDMTIRLEGSSKTAMTDDNGDFILSDVPFGTYTVIYEKSGYGTFKSFGIGHRNGNTTISNTPSLGQTSSTTITNLAASEESGTITIATTLDPEANNSNTRYIRYFFSTESNVSNENYEAVLDTFGAQINPYNLTLTTASLEALGFQGGQTVYVICYGESFWSNQYDDPDLDFTVFPNLNSNTSGAISFVVP